MMDDSTPPPAQPPGHGANTGRFGPSEPNDADEAPESPVTFRDATVFFAGGGFLGTLLIGVITVYQWLAPWRPALMAVAMGGLLSATIAFGYCNRDQKGAFLRGFLLWMLLALPTVAWGYAPVRAATLDLFGTELAEQAQLNAMEDPAKQVLQSACTTLSKGNSTVIKSRLAERLATSPALGMECMKTLTAQDELQAASLSSNFLRHWQTALAAKDAPKVCASAPHLFEMSATQPAKPTLPLTRCAVGEATTPGEKTIAKCCADALVEHFDSATAYTDALGPTAEIDKLLVPSLFTTMTPYAFRNINASRHQLPRLQKKLLRKKPTQQWLTALSCNGMINSYNPSDFFGGMEAIAQAEGCNLSIGDERGASQWQEICFQWAQAPDKGLCEPIEDQAKAQAVHAAATQVHSAIHSFYTSDVGRKIIAGAAFLRRSDGTITGFGKQLSDAYNPRNLPPGITNAQYRHAARSFNGDTGAYLQALQEHAPDLSRADVEDRTKMAQELLKKGINPKMSWDEAKKLMSPEQRARMQPRVDEVKKTLDSMDNPDDSPFSDLVR